MERNRETRRGTTVAAAAATTAANGLSRRRYRNGTLRDSPNSRSDEDGAMELQRLRDREKNERSIRTKRRRGEKSMYVSNQEEEERSSDESVYEEEVEEEEEEEEEEGEIHDSSYSPTNPMASVMAVSLSLSSMSPLNQHPRRSPPAKVISTVAPRKVAEKMIGVSIPKKARSGSSRGAGGNTSEVMTRQSSTSPARQSPVSGMPAVTANPSPSNLSDKKKMTREPIGAKNQAPKVAKTLTQESEIEFEIAEVLFGMTRQFQSSPKEENATNSSQKSSSRDGIPQSGITLQDSNSSVVASKRKKMMPQRLEEEGSSNLVISDGNGYASIANIEAKEELSSHEKEKEMAAAIENDGGSVELGISEMKSGLPALIQDSVNMESDQEPMQEHIVAVAGGEDDVETKKEMTLPLNECPSVNLGSKLENAGSMKTNSVPFATEEQLKINLMSSPSGNLPSEMSVDMDELIKAQEPIAMDTETLAEKLTKEVKEEKKEGTQKEGEKVAMTVEKTELTVERIHDPKENVEKVGKEKLQSQKQAVKAKRSPSEAEKAVQSALPPPMTIPGWPGGISPIGYIGQIQPSVASVSMDGSVATKMQPPSCLLPHQPSLKRCATHCYIAQKIKHHKHFAQINPIWPGATVSVPPPLSANLSNPMQGSSAGKSLFSLQDKASGTALEDHTSKDKNSLAQLMLQQLPIAPFANNVSPHAFIYPFNQQEPAAMIQSEAAKSMAVAGKALPSISAVTSVVSSAISTPATTLSFNNAGLPSNDIQYLTMIPSNGYPFPFPAPNGAPPLLRGSHHPALPVPFFNGSFYAPPVIHTSQFQQQQQVGTQNSTVTNGPSSSVKHNSTSYGFPTSKERQQAQRHCSPSMSNGDSHCTTDSSNSHAQKNADKHNFAMPLHPQNFTLMFPDALNTHNQGDKKQQHSQSQPFAMSFAALNGVGVSQGINFSTLPANNAFFQNVPGATSCVVQQKIQKSVDEIKTPNGLINSIASVEDDRKIAGKSSSSIPVIPSYSFSIQDTDPLIPKFFGSAVPDSSMQTSSSISCSGNGTQTLSHSGAINPSPTNAPNSQYHQKQQQQFASHGKSISSNAYIYPSIGKFPNGVSVYPTQWNTSTNAMTKAIATPQASTSPKNLTQQQNHRTQLGVPVSGQMQISFGGRNDDTGPSTLSLSTDVNKTISVKPQQQSLQQAQSFFSGSYPKRQSEQQLWQHNSFAASSTGMISLSSPSASNSSGATPAATANNIKWLPPQGFLHGTPHLFMSTTIPYIHSMPVKSAEQKPAAGN